MEKKEQQLRRQTLRLSHIMENDSKVAFVLLSPRTKSSMLVTLFLDLLSMSCVIVLMVVNPGVNGANQELYHLLKGFS